MAGKDFVICKKCLGTRVRGSMVAGKEMEKGWSCLITWVRWGVEFFSREHYKECVLTAGNRSYGVTWRDEVRWLRSLWLLGRVRWNCCYNTLQERSGSMNEFGMGRITV